MISALLLLTGVVVFLLDSRRKQEERKYYQAAYKILKEEYLDQAIKKNGTGTACEIGEVREMLCLSVQRQKKGDAYVFDPVIPVTIGREAEENSLCLRDGAISGRHCRIRLIRDELWLTDERSSNGTYVRRKKKDYWIGDGNSIRLQEGDVLFMGEMRLRVHIFYFDTMYL